MAQYYDYDSYQAQDYSPPNSKTSTNLLEVFLPILSLIILVSTSVWGFWSQKVDARSLQKQADLQNILTALNDFYKHSHKIPGKRHYPVAKCQGKLNSVDYEYTLRKILTGQNPNVDTHTFITPKDFPNDPWGIYTSQLSGHSSQTLPTCQVTQKFSESRQLVYPDLQIPSCLYNPRQAAYRNCYLYTTSAIGDNFELAYYDDSKSQFVIYSKFRNQPLEKTVEKVG